MVQPSTSYTYTLAPVFFCAGQLLVLFLRLAVQLEFYCIDQFVYQLNSNLKLPSPKNFPLSYGKLDIGGCSFDFWVVFQGCGSVRRASGSDWTGLAWQPIWVRRNTAPEHTGPDPKNITGRN